MKRKKKRKGYNNSKSDVKISTKNKDRLFNFIFGREENKKWTLELYNAVNESAYTDESLIEFNTLEDYLYVSMKNDTSFLFQNSISLYEHQSTYNPNMPLRFMQYIARLYESYVNDNSLNKFGSSILELPVPKLVTFYNGDKDSEDETVLKLSNSFKENLKDKTDIEVKVRMLNINYGHNEKLMNACKPLNEYAWFIDRMRNNTECKSVDESVNSAIIDMPEDFLIKAFLRKHMSEVANMLKMEYQEKNAKDLIARANYKKGKEDGRVEGRVEGIEEGIDNVNKLNSYLLEAGRIDDLKKATNDKAFQKKLIDELF